MMTTINGTKGANCLVGTDGDDTINGRKGADVIDGRGGADWLAGGKGKDTFLFRADQVDVDTIADFQAGKDRIVVEAADGQVVTYLNSSIHVVEQAGLSLTVGPAIASILDGPPTFFSTTDLIVI